MRARRQPAFTDNSGTLCYDTVPDGTGVNQRALLGLSVSSYFWSSTIYEVSTAAAWGAYLTGGGISVGGLNDPFNLLPVWPVRGGGFSRRGRKRQRAVLRLNLGRRNPWPAPTALMKPRRRWTSRGDVTKPCQITLRS